ncbi:MAG: hypothetical protein QM754_09775 [Tepidisphaeraceae bacterium]
MPRPLIALAAAAAVLSSFASLSFAQDSAADDNKMGPFQFSGLINSDNVYARSYSSENDYPVAKLSKGDKVIVGGGRGEWLKILPPDDVFCLVGKAWVDARANGTVGRVRDDANNIPVRLASAINPQQYGKVVNQVNAGQDVKILGQFESAYFKIAPPAYTFVYVHKRFVDVIKRVDVVDDHGTLVVKQSSEQAIDTKPKPNNDAPKTPDTSTTQKEPKLVEVTPTPDTNTSATQPANTVVDNTTPPATQPTETAVVAPVDFKSLEDRFMAASKQPLTQQPIDGLIADYQKVLDDKSTPPAVRQIAEYRMTGLKLRQEAAVNLKATEAAQAQSAARQKALASEGEEISQKIAQNELRRYTAVGTLRTSTLPNNGKPLFRLTDPASGRTVVYVVDNGNLAGQEGQFIGIRGVLSDDANRQIKLLTPQSVDAVKPEDVSSGAVSSVMTPASLTKAEAAR